VRGLERDLLVREAQAREPGGGVGLVAKAIARLLCRRSVISEAVGLHDEAQIRPVEIDLEAVHDLPREGERQACPPHDARDRDASRTAEVTPEALSPPGTLGG
jgi:hypothetical protein